MEYVFQLEQHLDKLGLLWEDVGLYDEDYIAEHGLQFEL